MAAATTTTLLLLLLPHSVRYYDPRSRACVLVRRCDTTAAARDWSEILVVVVAGTAADTIRRRAPWPHNTARVYTAVLYSAATAATTTTLLLLLLLLLLIWKRDVFILLLLFIIVTRRRVVHRTACSRVRGVLFCYVYRYVL